MRPNEYARVGLAVFKFLPILTKSVSKITHPKSKEE